MLPVGLPDVAKKIVHLAGLRNPQRFTDLSILPDEFDAHAIASVATSFQI
jgi:hypothetical protein